MADLYSLLAGQGQGQDYYRARDPFFMGGMGLSQTPLPQAKTNSQAILGPLLQGLMAGTLTGYGKKQAKETAFKDYSKNPILQALSGQNGAYASPTAPEGWTADTGQRDLLLAALRSQQADEETQRKAEDAAKIRMALLNQGAMVDPTITDPSKMLSTPATAVPGLADIKASEAGKVAAAKEGAKDKSIMSLMTPADRAEAARTSGLMKILDDVKVDLDQFDPNKRLDFQLKKTLSATDQGKFQKKLDLVAGIITKAVQGARPSDYDAKVYKAIVSGDKSVNPADIKMLVAQAQKLFAKEQIGKIQGYQQLASGDIVSNLQTYADMPMPDSKPRYEIRTAPNGQQYKVLLGQ